MAACGATSLDMEFSSSKPSGSGLVACEKRRHSIIAHAHARSVLCTSCMRFIYVAPFLHCFVQCDMVHQYTHMQGRLVCDPAYVIYVSLSNPSAA